MVSMLSGVAHIDMIEWRGPHFCSLRRLNSEDLMSDDAFGWIVTWQA